jgi:hypothetical protein
VPNHTYLIDVYTDVAGDANPENDHSTSSVVTFASSETNVIGTFNGINALVTAPALILVL